MAKTISSNTFTFMKNYKSVNKHFNLYFFARNHKGDLYGYILHIIAFCPEHPKWDQILKFTPLSETKSIPPLFIWDSPPPPPPEISVGLTEKLLYFCFKSHKGDVLYGFRNLLPEIYCAT